MFAKDVNLKEAIGRDKGSKVDQKETEVGKVICYVMICEQFVAYCKEAIYLTLPILPSVGGSEHVFYYFEIHFLKVNL